MLARHLGFQRVIFDCDSTLVSVEGIDELARLKGAAEHIAELTRMAMDGKIPLERVYAERLALLRPTRAEMDEVGRIYRRTLVPRAAEVVTALQTAGVEVFVVSGGLKAAVLDLAEALDIPAQNVYAVAVEMDVLRGDWWDYLRHRYAGNPQEVYLDFAPTPLAESTGKAAVARTIAEGKRTMLVGDGSTDLAAKEAVRLFVGYGGVESRPAVKDGAEVFIESASLAGVLPLALSPYAAGKLAGALAEVFDEGLQEIEEGKVHFKDAMYRERVLQSHAGVGVGKVFGE
ncbi:MAG: HAD-IB family phosphatase [Anaerolineales bacterium]